MALHDPKDTLAYAASRVLCQHRDMRAAPLSSVVALAAKQIASGDKAHPEKDALWFYGMNHGLALISARRAPLEPLPEVELRFVQDYHLHLAPRAMRAFYYLLVICTREFRHCKNMAGVAVEVGYKFSPKIAGFLNGLVAGDGEQQIWKKLVAGAPDCTIGQFSAALRWGFENGAWSGGYGGKAWGKVTDCLCKFVSGEYSAETMLDTVWTLCHNNGPIFNKPMLYHHYEEKLVQLLDVQRSGQIPAMIVEGYLFSKHTDQGLLSWMLWLRTHFPAAIGEYVDWYVVEALGAVGTYPQAQKAQVSKYGPSPAAAQLQAMHEKVNAANIAKVQAAAQAAALKQAEKAKHSFEVQPGVFVKKAKLKRAA